jgi:hypothetical protein
LADTRLLTTDVEDYVRQVLTKRHGQLFRKQSLLLRSGGRHEFDAVSKDTSVVASIKSSSGLTAGGNVPWGKINSSVADVYYLSLVDAQNRLLVLTTREFFDLFTKKMVGRIAPEVLVECIPLPQMLQVASDAARQSRRSCQEGERRGPTPGQVQDRRRRD